MKTDLDLVILRIISNLFEENGYVLHISGGREALVIDPGSDAKLFVDYLRKNSLDLGMIVLTHSHPDHIVGVPEMLEAFPNAKIAAGINEASAFNDPMKNLSALLGTAISIRTPDILLKDGEETVLCGINFKVLEIPGHSPGHIALVTTKSKTHVFGGDILFQGGIGRCDFPGGSYPTLVKGIREKLFILPGDSIVYPGHGDSTTIDTERETNPFLTSSMG